MDQTEDLLKLLNMVPLEALIEEMGSLINKYNLNQTKATRDKIISCAIGITAKHAIKIHGSVGDAIAELRTIDHLKKHASVNPKTN